MKFTSNLRMKSPTFIKLFAHLLGIFFSYNQIYDPQTERERERAIQTLTHNHPLRTFNLISIQFIGLGANPWQRIPNVHIIIQL